MTIDLTVGEVPGTGSYHPKRQPDACGLAGRKGRLTPGADVDLPIGPLLGSAVMCTSSPAAMSSCVKWSTIVDLSAPLGPSMLTNRPRGCSEKDRSFILAPFWWISVECLN